MGDKLLAGLQLMVFGMGMVYVFLIIMIFCMKLMSKVIAPIAAKQKAAEDAAKAAAKKPAAAAASSDESAVIAAAVAAVAARR
ncbi:MAG: OadG family protein [Lentisphaeria bacterium]|nr:OadG family protein [Lentisphaeria bacterium]